MPRSTPTADSPLDVIGPIRDQRTMIGVAHPADAHQTVADVEAAWVAWAMTNGLRMRARRGDPSTELRQSNLVLEAYVSGGTWIADCPSCKDGVACWIENPRGCCLGCGTIYRIDFPTRDDAEAAVRLLAVRPRIADQTWNRHCGQTLDDLHAENQLLEDAGEIATPGVSVPLGRVEAILGADAARRLRDELGDGL